MVGSAQFFFIFLADGLYRSAVATLQSRAEKDALFAELEQAKANSDEARRRAEEANLAKSRFLATMSHELRTPLNAILGFSEVMKNEVFGPPRRAVLQGICRRHPRQRPAPAHLINEILDLSRIEAGRYELQEEAVQLAYVVEDCRHMMDLRAKAKNQTVRADRSTRPCRGSGPTSGRCARSCSTCLSNAIKFTPPGGEIAVKVGWTSSRRAICQRQGHRTRHSRRRDPDRHVRPSGAARSPSRPPSRAPGLGLPIVKGFVDLHGGGFQLKSKPREGTEVIVTFPAGARHATRCRRCRRREAAKAAPSAGGLAASEFARRHPRLLERRHVAVAARRPP